MKTINIIKIEYVIFAGSSTSFNGNAVPPATTNLTTQERAYNTAIINASAEALKQNPSYLIMLHGHANATDNTTEEEAILNEISLARAESAKEHLLALYSSINNGIALEDARFSVSGYGSNRNIVMGVNSPYASLNRRVEVILFEIASK